MNHVSYSHGHLNFTLFANNQIRIRDEFPTQTPIYAARSNACWVHVWPIRKLAYAGNFSGNWETWCSQMRHKNVHHSFGIRPRRDGWRRKNCSPWTCSRRKWCPRFVLDWSDLTVIAEYCSTYFLWRNHVLSSVNTFRWICTYESRFGWADHNCRRVLGTRDCSLPFCLNRTRSRWSRRRVLEELGVSMCSSRKLHFFGYRAIECSSICRWLCLHNLSNDINFG